jgi:hypothetical protein
MKLAHDNRASLTKFSDSGSITDACGKLANPRLRAFHVQLIFDSHRNAVHRTAPVALVDFRLRVTSFLHGAVCH